MKRYLITLLSIICIYSLATPSVQKEVSDAMTPVFVFDLNGVLFDTDSSAVFRQLGMKDALWYLARYRSANMIKVRFYETLHRIVNSNVNSLGVKDPDNAVMPQLMVDWLCGTHPNKLLLNRIIDAINTNPQWFLNPTEQRLMGAMARAIFDPKQFIASRKLLSELAPLLGVLKQHGVKLYILSNWDKESFELLKERFPYVFMFFDGHIISGEKGLVKPQPEIYTHAHNHILMTVKNPHICFLDDQQENLVSAQKAGWHTIHVNKTSSYFGFTSKIDVDTIKKNALLFLEKYLSISPTVTIPINLDAEHYATE